MRPSGGPRQYLAHTSSRAARGEIRPSSRISPPPSLSRRRRRRRRRRQSGRTRRHPHWAHRSGNGRHRNRESSNGTRAGSGAAAGSRLELKTICPDRVSGRKTSPGLASLSRRLPIGSRWWPTRKSTSWWNSRVFPTARRSPWRPLRRQAPGHRRQLVAEYGAELAERSRAAGVNLGIEACVAGGNTAPACHPRRFGGGKLPRGLWDLERHDQLHSDGNGGARLSFCRGAG